MKRIVLLMVVFVLLASNDVSARGFVNNPDRFPSVGLSFGFSSLGGDVSTPVPNGFSVTPGADTSTFGVDTQTKDLTLDFRLPVSHSLTVFGGISVIRDSFDMDKNDLTVFEQHRDLDGYGVRFGARFYFNR